MNTLRKAAICTGAILAITTLPKSTFSQQVSRPHDIDQVFTRSIQPLLKRYCHDCHAGEEAEAEIDLESFASIADVRRQIKVWQKVATILDSGQMPPQDADHPSEDEREHLQDWIHLFLTAEAQARAGDPGPVVLRRLSNAEYTYTVRDLTGIDTLDPTREFPIDGAAGEGFTNTGGALVMSPSLVQKYLAAGKEIAAHAVLVPDGIRFSPHTTQRDWTDELLAEIRQIYARWTDSRGGKKINLQGLTFDTDQGGRLPLDKYLSATLVERQALTSGRKTIVEVASENGLNAKYLGKLWQELGQHDESNESFLLDLIRQKWRGATPEDVEPLLEQIRRLRAPFWKFNAVGHIGRENGPTIWMEAINPIRAAQEFRLELDPPPDGNQEVVVYATATAVDDSEDSYVIWKNARLEGADGPPIPFRDIKGLQRRMEQQGRAILANTERYLAAAAKAAGDTDIGDLAKAYQLDDELLCIWLEYLMIGDPRAVDVTGHFTEKMSNVQGYDFVNGWGVGATPQILANSSDQAVAIPGTSPPHSIVAHPSPTLFAAAGWQSPFSGVVRVEAHVADAHNCGNGQEWVVQHRSGRGTGNLWKGEFEVNGTATMPPRTVSVRKGDLISFMLGPRGGNHTCDLTNFNLVINQLDGKRRVWDLAKDVSNDILASNPHADRHGNKGVWHFYQGPAAEAIVEDHQTVGIPEKSLLGQWQVEKDAGKRSELARAVQALALGPRPVSINSPNTLLYEQLHALGTDIDVDALLKGVEADERFGKHPQGGAIDSADLIASVGDITEFHLPTELAAGRTVVVTGEVESPQQVAILEVSLTKPQADRPTLDELVTTRPFVAVKDGEAYRRLETMISEFRDLFPPALCYARIVPIDEVVTLTLFYRQDDYLQRLMLNRHDIAELDRRWDELIYVSHEPLRYLDGFEQLREFSTQDRPDLVQAWKVWIQPANDRADAFRQRLLDTQPIHLQAVVDLAERAWRRSLSHEERGRLRETYQRLRENELSHDESIRLTIARVFTSPAFLYRLEEPGPGNTATPVSSAELANRLSYFLWSSLPDGELLSVAESGELLRESTLLQQTRRMLRDHRTRRMAIHFACQMLHIRDFDQNSEKNEKLYPQFATMRGHMYEESVRFFEDMFRNNGSILDLLNADYTFLNEELARHYGIDGVTGAEWRRVDGVRADARGGVLGMATVLASLSGASRTSPILRGNWISETLLGERLPRPPANVPQLPDQVPSGLTARQLIELHSSVPECAKCHARIDPYGFALEQYDAVGRLRDDTVNTKTKLIGGKQIEGIDGLRDYLANDRREDVVHQFCKKLLGYSLGREVQLSDEPLLATMKVKLAENEYRFRVIVEEIVKSPQFRSIRGRQTVDK